MPWPELPDEWTHRPIWVPPYNLPDGLVPNPGCAKKDILGPKPKPYSFFDSPDHEDCFKKMSYMANYGLRIAAMISAADLWGNKQKTYSAAFGRIAFHFGRIGGSSILYSSVTCAVANIRGNKDDELNHMIGGASLGLIWGYKYHSTVIGTMVAVAGALCGFMYKRQDIQGWQVLPPHNSEFIREENGTLGGQRYGDWRIGWTSPDTTRKNLD